jgi:hypothetical protein
MIECIFTVDYEIYGNGGGSLKELVYEPMERLRAVFAKWNARFVTFVEAAELEMIEKHHADTAISDVLRQLGEMFDQGYEIGLHLHPQWYNAGYENGEWHLDYNEYNLCTLPYERIVQIVDRSIAYLRRVVGMADFTPLSFRAGNWLFQPTKTAAGVLADRGIKVDSSVFKGGLMRQHKLDYRAASGNGLYWRFSRDVTKVEEHGALLEFPIHTEMVPFWKMLTRKRVGLQRTKNTAPATGGLKRPNRLMDYLRPWYPLKLDFCRMTQDELISMVERAVEHEKNKQIYVPLVAIGHTKDLVDVNTVDAFMRYLSDKGISVGMFGTAYDRCAHQ